MKLASKKNTSEKRKMSEAQAQALEKARAAAMAAKVSKDNTQPDFKALTAEIARLADIMLSMKSDLESIKANQPKRLDTSFLNK